ncbi:hypothetical protein AZI87_09605 [Bdellovibrio bacteriovorus]|uniref:Uncharacterized protein n=1 Tax=Bdellovibrio bacteriovorus TaxID=959 RepID=A0A162H1C9_BDEBC|nr:hypothetical protein AZI87_09605 [Bdellovibrio bacteriovorus]
MWPYLYQNFTEMAESPVENTYSACKAFMPVKKVINMHRNRKTICNKKLASVRAEKGLFSL